MAINFAKLPAITIGILAFETKRKEIGRINLSELFIGNLFQENRDFCLL